MLEPASVAGTAAAAVAAAAGAAAPPIGAGALAEAPPGGDGGDACEPDVPAGAAVFSPSAAETGSAPPSERTNSGKSSRNVLSLRLNAWVLRASRALSASDERMAPAVISSDVINERKPDKMVESPQMGFQLSTCALVMLMHTDTPVSNRPDGVCMYRVGGWKG